jgi:hypothetical protein
MMDDEGHKPMEKRVLMGFTVVLLLIATLQTASARLLEEAPFSGHIGSRSTSQTLLQAKWQ